MNRLDALPHGQRGILSRPRLAPLMDGARDYAVVLVCAPAGSGKSVLVSDWARRQARHSMVAWLGCSNLVDTPGAFWAGVTETLECEVDHPESGPGPRPRTPARDHRPGPLDQLLLRLGELPAGTVLVWDDFQEVGSPDTQRDVQYVIDHLPLTVTVMILTRSFPQLSVHRARVEGRLLDIRASDLAFTLAETRELLAVNGVELDDVGRELVQARTQGWAAGLRLAIISMSHADDPAEVVQGLAESTDAVSGYLTEEVLARLDPADRDFLLRTCVVTELSDPLVAHLVPALARNGSLEQVAGRIGFLAPVHRPDRTYCYHPLFAQLLRHELQHAAPQLYVEQHRRAAIWYERASRPVEAVWHAQQAQDWDLAARAAIANALRMVMRGQISELDQLITGFPHDLATTDPRILLLSAITALLSNAEDRSTALLERAVAGLPSGNDLASRRTRAVASYGRAVAARYRGDTAASLAAMTADGPNVPGPDDTGFVLGDLDVWAAWRGSRAAALLWDDQLEAAADWASQACDDVRRGAGGWPMITGLGVLSVAHALAGRLVEGQRAVDELARFVDEHGWADAPYVAIGDFGAAWIALERGEPAAAEQHLIKAECRFRQLSGSYPGVMIDILRARLTALAGDGPEAARRLLDGQAGRHDAAAARLPVRLAKLVRLEIALAEGDAEQAAALSGAGSVGLRRYVAARAGVVDPCELSQLADQDTWLRIRILLAGAVVLHRARDAPGADVLLDQALDLTALEGFRLPYHQLGEPLRQLLIEARLSAVRHGRLIAELLTDTAGKRCVAADLVDPLSTRELDVLRHLVAGQDIDEIAGDLYVSRNTVRTHTKNIYRKLTVRNRRDAVVRAAALHLI